MWQKRRGGERNTISITPPHLGEQYPVSSWRGSAFVLLRTLPLKSEEQTDALTHWPAAVRREDGAKHLLHSARFDSVLGQFLSNNQYRVCARLYESEGRLSGEWLKVIQFGAKKQKCSPHVHSSLVPVAPRCPWDLREALPPSSWKRSSSLRSFGKGLSRLWPPQDQRVSLWLASPPVGEWLSKYLRFAVFTSILLQQLMWTLAQTSHFSLTLNFVSTWLWSYCWYSWCTLSFNFIYIFF